MRGSAATLTSRQRVLASLVLLVVMIACGDATRPPVSVYSLREALLALEQAPFAWSGDAYLADAGVALRDRHPGTWPVDAGLRSPSREYEGLLVTLEEDGGITSEVVPQEVPVIQIEPITEEDWLLDSTEALERALDEEGRRYLEEHADSHCGYLKLERDLGEPGQPVVWRRSLGECLGPGLMPDTLLDPITGEVLSRD